MVILKKLILEEIKEKNCQNLTVGGLDLGAWNVRSVVTFKDVYLHPSVNEFIKQLGQA